MKWTNTQYSHMEKSMTTRDMSPQSLCYCHMPNMLLHTHKNRPNAQSVKMQQVAITTIRDTSSERHAQACTTYDRFMTTGNAMCHSTFTTTDSRQLLPLCRHDVPHCNFSNRPSASWDDVNTLGKINPSSQDRCRLYKGFLRKML